MSEVLLPSQQRYLIAASVAIHEAEQRLRSRSVLSRSQRHAVLTALSLLLTSHSTSVSSLATWDPRRQQIASPEQRGIRVVPAMFAEAGPATIRRWWRASLNRLLEHMERSEDRAAPVHARLADAAHTGLPASCADAVIWDPPHYDNLDYADLSRPYELVLAGLPTPMANSISPHTHGDTSRQRVWFDVQRYEAELSAQADEVIRLLRPNARVGVLWTARDAKDLQSFLNIIASSGVELQQAVRLSEQARTRTSPTSPNALRPSVTYLLVLRQVAGAARRSRSPVDAGRVLHLADMGSPALYEGLARILLDHWDEQETRRHLSSTKPPAVVLMAAKYVASHPAPADLLLELGRPALLRILDELGGDQMAAASPDVHAVPHAVLRLLGFSVASSSGFSIPSALRRAQQASERLRRSTGIQDARESTLTIVTEVERVLRFASVAWAHLLADDWTTPVAEIVAKSSSKTFRDLRSMAFGDWKAVFCQLPGRLRNLPQRGTVFDVVAATVRKQKTDEHLSAIVRVRNAVVHDDAEYFSRPESDLVGDMYSACTRAINVLSQLYQAHVLPMALQPQEERRDRYGRRLLTLTDADGIGVDVFVTRETDMSQPLIYVASGVSIRDVAPILLSANTIEAALSQPK
ncbi:hypothetical protein [Micromonospora chalcea]|uniref:hypothetical protein n=1 Tax=Micromonospora chalcea TaxID=1874 RepID=UPI003CEDF8BA